MKLHNACNQQVTDGLKNHRRRLNSKTAAFPGSMTKSMTFRTAKPCTGLFDMHRIFSYQHICISIFNMLKRHYFTLNRILFAKHTIRKEEPCIFRIRQSKPVWTRMCKYSTTLHNFELIRCMRLNYLRSLFLCMFHLQPFPVSQTSSGPLPLLPPRPRQEVLR